MSSNLCSIQKFVHILQPISWWVPESSSVSSIARHPRLHPSMYQRRSWGSPIHSMFSLSLSLFLQRLVSKVNCHWILFTVPTRWILHLYHMQGRVIAKSYKVHITQQNLVARCVSWTVCGLSLYRAWSSKGFRNKVLHESTVNLYRFYFHCVRTRKVRPRPAQGWFSGKGWKRYLGQRPYIWCSFGSPSTFEGHFPQLQGPGLLSAAIDRIPCTWIQSIHFVSTCFRTQTKNQSNLSKFFR